jgi:signal transduction histidine kinase
MIKRFMATLDRPRWHLGFLVSLLVLVFALTGIVAYRAIEADRNRSSIVAQVVERGITRAAGEWASLYHQSVNSALSGFTFNVVEPLLLEGSLSADNVARRMRQELDCRFCADSLRVEAVYLLAVPSLQILSATAPFDTAVARRAVAALVSDTFPIFTDRMRGIAYFDTAASHVHSTLMLAVMDAATGAAEMAVGIVLTSASSRDLLEGTFVHAQQLAGTTQAVAPEDSLYHRAAFVHGERLMGDAFSGGHYNAPGSPIYGLRFGVALRDSYAQAAYDESTQGLAVIGLMVLIGGLLMMAALQVRRESQLMRLRADFVSSVSHELRTPLAQIRMFVETLLLGRTRSDIERQRSLEIIEQEARRLSHLVENVLLFSKTEGGRMPRIAPEPTDFAGDIRRAVDGFSLLSRARDAEIRTELQENITLQVDRGALRQILINLIDNALKYGPSGQRITVGAAVFDDVARLWVDDEGPGIPEESRARVFESFYRLPREMSAHVAGSGIGLAVVRELARLHDGDVWAEDAPGGGARFVVQFPGAYVRAPRPGSFAAAS